MTSIAFVTPSYVPDLERCALLVESLDRFAPDYRHYLIVDSAEIAAFRHLASHRTILVPSEEVLDSRYHRLPGKSGIWLSWRTLPVRGWMTQQLRKLGATVAASEDVLLCIDSDVALVRPFLPELLGTNQRLELLDVSYHDELIRRWTAISEELLGLEAGSVPLRGHVSPLVIWKRDNLQALYRHIEAATGMPWQIAIGRKMTFSEHTLYGVFVRAVLGYDSAGQTPSDRPLVKGPWQADLTTEAGIDDYVTNLDPGNVAVLVQSTFGIPAERIRPYFEKIWSRQG